MAAPGTHDFEVVGGDCLPISLRLLDDDDNPIDLTGYDARLDFTWRGGSFSVINDDSPTRIVLGGSDGTIQAELDGDETEQLPNGRLTKYELVLIQPDGCEQTPLIGYVVRY